MKAKEMTEQTLRILERDYDFENLKELAAIENLPPLEHASPESMVNLLERITFLDVGTKFLSEENRKGVNKAIEKLGGEEQIETLGQLKQFFGKITNTPITQQMNIVKSPWLDRFRWDTALAENNPFYKWMVNKITEKQLEAEAKYERIYQKFNRLIKKTGRHKGIQFKKWNDVIQYLEIDEVKHREKKKKTFDEFDDETKNVINFLEEYYTEAKNYLIKENVFQKGRTDYFTHTNRLIMETFFDGLQERLEAKKSKMTAVVGAMKDTFLDIIKSKRETIDFANDPQFSGDMPTSKFFKYSLERVAEDAHYSKDLPKSFLNYVRHFERKRYFDDVLPLIDNFATALKIDEGFLNDYIRNKFGNRVDIAGIKQGTVVDKTIRFAKTGLLLRYLVDSLSQFTSIFGEVASNFVNMEVHKFALGSQRLATKKGNKIANKYPELVDRTPFSDLLRSDIPLRYKTFGTLLAGYQTGAVFANRQYFLGSLTKEEWKSGKVSPERLAEIKLEMGRTRSVPGGKSVIGSTSLLGVVHQYRTWAFPLLRMVATDLGKTIKRIGNLKGKEILTANESKRLIKSLFLASVVYTLGDALFSNVDDEMKKKSVYLRTVDKGLRDLNAPFESLFALGAPPLVEYLTNIKLNVERMINTHVIDFPYYQHNID
ncbi:MAG: hypothetical protein GWN40_03415 [Nitrosopumilaceae archaeon]|nr:hypothetical protein [Nitrosopumilaceae archaeon]